MHVSLLYSQCHTLEVLIMPVLVHLSIHLRIHPSNLSNIHFVHCVYFISIHFFVHSFLQSLVYLFIFFLNGHIKRSQFLSSFLSSSLNQFLVLFIVFIFFYFICFASFVQPMAGQCQGQTYLEETYQTVLNRPRTELVEPTDCDDGDDDDDDDDDLFAPQATFINTLPGSSRSNHTFYCPQSLRCLGLYLYQKICSAWCKLKMRI